MDGLPRRLTLLALATGLLGACATSGPDVGPGPNVLVVGVTPTYPPIVFKQNQELAGVEVDLAHSLGSRLGRTVQFVELRWDEEIPALVGRTIDIIMSGMSITEARQVRVAFSQPYLAAGLFAAFRVQDQARYTSRESILKTAETVGVIEGTTGDVFAQRNLPNARRIAFSQASDAARGLRQRTIDLFIHDGPSIAWQVSTYEAELAAFREPLNQEWLAWALRRDDTVLLSQVNAALAEWKGDGTLNRILGKWLPPWELWRP
jgi:ABC-type amino acid transport substrate-binding protein